MVKPIDNLSVYVINLEKSQGRLKAVQKNFTARNIPFERFVAIAGDSLSPEYIKTIHENQRWTAPLSPNEIACYKSHIEVLRYFLEHSQNEYAFICEDDTGLDNQIRQKITALINNWPTDCHMIKPYILAFPSGELMKTIPFSQGASQGQFSIYLYKPFKIASTALCHIVSRQGAQKIIDNMKFTRPVDVDFQCPWEHDVNILQTSDIRNIIAPQGGISSIQRPKKKALSAHIKHIYYRIWHYVMNIYHHGKVWGLPTTLKYAIAYQKDKTIYKTKMRRIRAMNKKKL